MTYRSADADVADTDKAATCARDAIPKKRLPGSTPTLVRAAAECRSLPGWGSQLLGQLAAFARRRPPECIAGPRPYVG